MPAPNLDVSGLLEAEMTETTWVLGLALRFRCLAWHGQRVPGVLAPGPFSSRSFSLSPTDELERWYDGHTAALT